MIRESFKHAESGTEFRYESEYTGDVLVTVSTAQGRETTRLPLAGVVAFVAELARQRQTADIAAASDWEVLGVVEDDDEDDDDVDE